MRHPRFVCPRLSSPYLTCFPRLLTRTFTTTAFDRSSFWRFEACSYKPTSKDLPSSLVQHDACASSCHNLAHHRTYGSRIRRFGGLSGRTPFHRSVGSPCPSPGFIPVDRVAQGQRELPVGCAPVARHEATSPLLHSPCGVPFGPSGRGGAARPLCGPAFRRWGASLAGPASDLLCPLLTSAGRSG